MLEHGASISWLQHRADRKSDTETTTQHPVDFQNKTQKSKKGKKKKKETDPRTFCNSWLGILQLQLSVSAALKTQPVVDETRKDGEKPQRSRSAAELKVLKHFDGWLVSLAQIWKRRSRMKNLWKKKTVTKLQCAYSIHTNYPHRTYGPCCQQPLSAARRC